MSKPPTTVEVSPSGVTIEFWDSLDASGEKQQRRYLCNGKRFVNVTTVLGILDKPALLDWAANLAREGKDWREVRDEAGDRGKGAHELILRSLVAGFASLADLPDEHRAWGQAAFRWMRERKPEVVEAEKMVAAPSHGYAGRFDLLARMDGRLALCDFKTLSRAPFKRKDGEQTHEVLPPYDENLLQLDLYSAAIHECGYPEPDQGLIVRLDPEGNYHETFVDLDPDRGLGILTAYRSKSLAGKALRAATKAQHIHQETNAQIEQMVGAS